MGSQLAATLPDCRYDGVLGIWYGKSPGVDRAADALRHAVYTGTAEAGGAVAFVGDDPSAKSSTLPSSSAGLLSDLHMPMLYPADPAEVLELGRHAIASSRASGLWTAMKIVADVADGTASVELDPERTRPVIPEIEGLALPRPPEGRLLTPLSLDLEREIYEVRYRCATAYAAAESTQPHHRRPAPTHGSASPRRASRIGSCGRRSDGSDSPTSSRSAALGIRLLKLQLPLPLDPATVREFARGLRSCSSSRRSSRNIELLVKDALYASAERPRVLGRSTSAATTSSPASAHSTPTRSVPACDGATHACGHRLVADATSPHRVPVTSVTRSPFYCSGCPHNRSTTRYPTAPSSGPASVATRWRY